MLLKPICGHQGHVPRSSRFFCCGWRCLLWPRRRGWGPRSWNSFASVDKCVCVFFTGALQSSAMMSLVRGAAYAAVFMVGQGCTLGHLFRFSEEGPLLCRLRSSPVFVSEFPAQGACIRGNGFKFQANLQLGKGKEGVVRFFFQDWEKIVHGDVKNTAHCKQIVD